MKDLAHLPFALSDGDYSYAKLAQDITDCLDQLESEPFGFKASNISGGAKRTEELRRIYPINQVFKLNPSLRGELVRWSQVRIPIFLSALCARMRDETFTSTPTDFGITLRVRIMEDLPGYSLAPHNDSADTLYAFILQLSDLNPTTSGFVSKENIIQLTFKRELKTEEVTDHATRAISQVVGYSPCLEWTYSQFNRSLVAWEPPNSLNPLRGNVWMVAHEGGEVLIKGWTECPLEVPFGNLLAIHNPETSFLFQSENSRINGRKSRHGVFPRIKKTRRLLLLDLLGNRTPLNHLPIEGMGSDPNSYYVSFRKDTSAKLLKESGFSECIS